MSTEEYPCKPIRHGDETTVLRGIAPGSTGGEICAIDSKDGKIVRIRPFDVRESYSQEQIDKAMWEYDIDGHVLKPTYKTQPTYFALSYKNRVYSKNRVKYPLKRVDWEPGGDPAKMNTANRGKSKFVRISWDEALDIMEAEIRRTIDKYGPYSVLCIGEDGHRESKDLQSGGGMHANLMSKLGGYTRETRTPDSVEGWYWGAKHVWGSGSNKGLGMPAMPQTGYNSWNVTYDITKNSDLITFCSGDWETSQNYASQFFSQVLRYWDELGKEMVSVDPWCNYTASIHKVKWIPIIPNTDAAFDLAIMYVWITENLYDKDYVATHSIGFDKVKAYILGTDEEGIPKTPAWAAERCGVPEYTIKAYARETGTKTTAYAHYSSGSIKGPYSHEPGRTEAYKLAMQGLGKPGVEQLYMNNSDMHKQKISKTTTMPYIMTNQCRMFYPSAQTIPRTRIADAINNGTVKWWGSPCIVYVETAEQFQEFNYPGSVENMKNLDPTLAAMLGWNTNPDSDAEPPKIDKFHMIWSEKPCNMACWNGGFEYQDAIRTDEVEFFVTNHMWLENDSLFADLVLPVTTCAEENDTVGASSITQYKHAGIQSAACPPVGESMSDWHIAIELAKRFGVDDQITMGMTDGEWAKYGFDQSDLGTEISWEEFCQKGYYLPEADPNWKDIKPGMTLFYEDPEQYPLDTPSGKLEFYSQALAENFPDDKERQPIAKWITGGPASEGWTHDESLWGEKCKTYPLLMVANPAKWRLHVQSDDVKWFREIETCKIRWKDGYQYEPVWLSPETAEARGIAQGDLLKVMNDQGTILGCAQITQRVIPGIALMNKCARVDPIAPHLDRGGSTNLISPPAGVSKHCTGFVVSGYLIDVQKVTDEEYEGWKRDYPDAFARDLDSAIGINYKSWVIED